MAEAAAAAEAATPGRLAAWRGLLALLALAAAVALDMLLAPLFGAGVRLLLAYPVVVAVAWAGGFWPAALLSVLAALALARLLPSEGEALAPLAIVLALYLLFGLLAAALGEALRRARRRARAQALGLRDEARQQQRLAAAAAATGLGFAALDDQLRYRWVLNPPPALGLDAARWAGHGAAALFGREQAAPLVAAQQRVLGEGQALAAEFELGGPQGRRCIEQTIAPCFAADAAGTRRVVGLYCSWRDVTEARAAREQAAREAAVLPPATMPALPPALPSALSSAGSAGDEAELAAERAAHAELQRAARLQDEFLANLSHELRTPLNAIAGWTHVLGRADAADGALMQRAAEAIERNVRTQSALVDKLLDISRIVGGRLSIERQPCDVGMALRRALDAVRPAAQAKWIAIDDAATLQQPPAPCMGDAARLEQVFVQLLDNAVKYTPLNGRVEVGMRQQAGRLRVEIRDNGAGIAPETLARLFDRFAQGDSSMSRRQGGLGLGLAIVRSVVELHGGSVAAASDGPGQGSCLAVELPLAEPAAGNAPAPRRPDGAGAAQPLAWRRILVLEDEADSLELMSLLLREQGAIVRAFDHPEQALAAAENSLFDLVISDIGVPGMDGLEFMRRLRTRPFVPKAIALTAYSGDEHRQQALAAGYNRVELKPIVPPEFLRVVIEELETVPALDP